MKEPKQIFFVTWPDGGVSEAAPGWDEDSALINFITNATGTESRFGRIQWGRRWGGGALYYFWPAMEAAGFKIQSVEVPAAPQKE